MWSIGLFSVVIIIFLTNADASSNCGGHYCLECCCESITGCCSCDSALTWWAWFAIVFAIIVIIAIAAGVGAWRRHVYLRRVGTTMVRNMPVATVIVTGTVNGGYAGYDGMSRVNDLKPPPFNNHYSEPQFDTVAYPGTPCPAY